MNEGWEFAMDTARTWFWRTVDLNTRMELRRSISTFETLALCVDDATMNGYERRSDDRRAGERRRG
ncbi:MAG: hypothetical protein JWO70_1526 [Betaproteobacteria bacterium]|nr:hypothetical protein [Betaproteobacteria bacterium]